MPASGLQPLGLCQALTFWAVTVTTRVVGDPDTIAACAAIDVTAQGGRTARDEVAHHGLLPGGDLMITPVGLSVCTEDVGDLEYRSPDRLLHRL